MNTLKLGLFSSAIIFFISLFLFLAWPTLAAVRCETQYGGGQVCVTTGQLQVNKKVWDPGSSTYVDNLVATGTKRFVSGEEVQFQVKITNVGDTTLDNVVFTDNLPSFLGFSSGNLSENLGSIAPGQTIERVIRARVVEASKLPLAPSTVCDDRTTNFAEAHNNDSSDRDTSRVCVENRVLGKVAPGPSPVKVIPSTGPEMLILAALPIFGTAGVYLRKLKVKYF